MTLAKAFKFHRETPIVRQEDKQRLAKSHLAELVTFCDIRAAHGHSLISSRGAADPEPARAVYGAHATIFMENDPADRIYQVMEGGIMLYKLLPDGRRQIVELIGAGDVFGLVNTRVHGATAETLFDTIVVSHDRRVVEKSPELSRAISHCIESQIVALHEHTMLLGRKSAIERVASFLIRLVPHRGVHDCVGPKEGAKDDAKVRLRMTRQEIADYLGLTIETVSRAFSELRRRGAITIEKQDEVIVNDVCRICHTTGAH